MWNNPKEYLCWLHEAYEQFKNAKFVYDKKGTRIFYNKPYWHRRFKMEIKRAEHQVVIQERLEMECSSVA